MQLVHELAALDVLRKLVRHLALIICTSGHPVYHAQALVASSRRSADTRARPRALTALQPTARFEGDFFSSCFFFCASVEADDVAGRKEGDGQEGDGHRSCGVIARSHGDAVGGD